MNLMHHSSKNIIYLKNIVSKIINNVSSKSKKIEVFLLKKTGICVNVRYGKIENIIYNNDNYIKLTLFFNKKQGIVSSTDLSEKSINKMIHYANEISKYTTKDISYGLPDKKMLAFNSLDLDLYHPIKNFNIEKIVNIASEVESYALKNDKRIINTEGGTFQSCITTNIIGNSYNFLENFTESKYLMSCGVLVKQNDSMECDYSYTTSRSLENLNSTKYVGNECAKKALSKINSKKINTQNSPVLFSSDVATSIFYHLCEAIYGINVYKKSTFLLEYINKKILPNWISIEEFPHIRKGLYSSYFDIEGVKTFNKKIVDNGILNTWLLNSFYARKLKLKSTGNCGGIYNWKVSHKKLNKNKLIKLMHNGLLITDIIGHGVNYINGDYSKGVSGFWVENGEIKFPVKEITIAGNLKEMFLNIVSISNDIDLKTNIQCGSVLISSMKIAGF